MDFINLTIEQTIKGLKEKQFSAAELCRSYLDAIEAKNKDIFAYLTLDAENALKAAEVVDKLVAENKPIPSLAGIPFAIKDNILLKGVRCTAGSKILEKYTAPYNATVVKKLKNRGAVILGKTNLDEFAMGSSNEYSAFGPTKNPHDLTRVAGGSSGGSAAAVAGKMAIAAIGSDTCGSIRLPASFCGVVGLKPTYGSVSRYGLIAMASSLDQIGPLARTVRDCRIVFESIRGWDKMDSTSVDLDRFWRSDSDPQKNPEFSMRDLKIGIPKEYFIKGMDQEIEKAVKDAIGKFEDLGAHIEEISLPYTKYTLPTYYILMPSEVSANLARYDGIKYGLSQAGGSLLDVYLKSRHDGLGEEVKRRIMLGTFALSSGYYEAYYLRAQRVRAKIKEDFEKAFKVADIILAPASPSPAFKLGEKMQDPVKMYLSDVFMGAVNLAGLPAIAVPWGKADNLPTGFQLIGNIFEEEKILRAGEIFETTYANT